ncbi:MAG TPA: malto-oligosyltrehalose synthase [Myxococcota bacterium]|nr:malto-oligosyltrehalose synthase [Myxococcota bacterium]
MRAAPLATYRLQLRAELGFSAAADLCDYLADLGVSHLYCSPALRAVPGSPHGYDVVDPTVPNPELGGVPGFRLLSLRTQQRGLGILLDIVPNHMAIRGPENRWWWDVLENGPSSRFASLFDVDWTPSARAGDRILLPVLEECYGRVLERGEISLLLDGGRFLVSASGSLYPLAPKSADGLLREAAHRTGSRLLAFLADAHAALPHSSSIDHESSERRHRDKEVLADLLARLCAEEPGIRQEIEKVVAERSADRDALHALLERQNYRLARWRTATSHVDYRRFFDVNHLIGIRVEDARVFAHVHERILDWLASGEIDGVRVDHLDGLREPEGYLRRLRAAAPRAWLVVEKILSGDETLDARLAADGTTGYEFLARSLGVLLDPDGEAPLTDAYQALTGDRRAWDGVRRRAKEQVLRELLGSELARLTALWAQIAERDPCRRDYNPGDFEAALVAFLVALPVYRTYVSEADDAPEPADAAVLERAFAAARELRPDLEPGLLDFLEEILRRRLRGELETELVLRLQQLSGAVMAKGVEDTAGYAYPRLVALCEVGCDPGAFGTSVERFHAANAAVQAAHPTTLLATSTHDTKRSEDVRARIALLSEIPSAWREVVEGWFARNAAHRGASGPDRKIEYLLYQTLVGAWPIEADRLAEYARKAAREAKEKTSWLAPDATYEAELEAFVRGILADEAFVAALERFLEPLVEPGRRNSLAMTLLKLASPGVPDLYQGSELWDLSLVDPDNRRPVDFELRRKRLAEIRSASAAAVLRRADEGLPKLFLIQRALALRRRYPERFDARSRYAALPVAGRAAAHVIAFERCDLVCLVPRLPMRFDGDWGETRLELARGTWRDAFSDEAREGGTAYVRDLFSAFPVALLSREDAA